MPRVKDYMTTPVITITENESIGTAVRLMNTHNTNGLVVVDEKNPRKVRGIISSLDILRHLVPDYFRDDERLAAFEPSGLFTKRVLEISSESVKLCMTEKLLRTVTADDTLVEAAALLAEHRIHRLPVLDEKGDLIGCVTRSDIKRAFQEILDLKK